MRLLRVVMDVNRQLKLFASNHTTLQINDATQLAVITITDSSRPVTSSNNMLAYRPRFADNHNSNLAVCLLISKVCFHAFSHSLATTQSVESFLKKKMDLEMERP